MTKRMMVLALASTLIAAPSLAAPGVSPAAATQLVTVTGRTRDQATNPDYLQMIAAACAVSSTADACVSDPFRTLDRWSPARGDAMKVHFTNRYGATLRAEMFAPPANFVDPVTNAPSSGPFPLVIIIPGLSEARQEYRWAAEGLAEAGYVTFEFDPQGFGESDVAPNPTSTYCDPNGSWKQPQEMGFTENGSCAGEPPADTYEQYGGTAEALALGDWSVIKKVYDDYAPNSIFGAIDSLNWLLSSNDPWQARIDATRIGVAGHSLGAFASMMLGNGDPLHRFLASVAWDGYATMDHGVTPTVPTMFQQSQQEDAHGFTYVIPPDPQGFHPTRATFNSFRDRCVPSAFTVLSGSAHHEWAYATGQDASADGERVGMYYTLAWFDRFLKGATTSSTRGDEAQQSSNAAARLTATTFDSSADASAIGTGYWDPMTQQNVPHLIAGQSIAPHLSPFFDSEQRLHPC
ncbi:MAG: hypothetical protein ACYDCC_01580 [Actinomycetota bacterium]